MERLEISLWRTSEMTSRFDTAAVDDALKRIRARRHGITGSINHLRRELLMISAQVPAARREVVEWETRVLTQALSLLTQQPPEIRTLTKADREIEELVNLDHALGLAK